VRAAAKKAPVPRIWMTRAARLRKGFKDFCQEIFNDLFAVALPNSFCTLLPGLAKHS
jgi:hypothetical protein